MSALSDPPATTRAQAVERVAELLPQRAARLSRLWVRFVSHEITRTEAGILSTLAKGERRVTELAELEGVAQPTMTLLVQRLEARRWVERRRDPSDRRVVLVSLSDQGRAVLDDVRAQYRAVLRTRLAELPDEQLHALVAATDALGPLIDALHD